MEATALIEEVKSGHLETTFGGRRKLVEIPDVHVVVLSNNAPDLSTLSKDRWHLWRLGGKRFGNLIWPCRAIPKVRRYNDKKDKVTWCVILKNLIYEDFKNLPSYKNIDINPEWFKKQSTINDCKLTFGMYHQMTNNLVSIGYEVPNFIRLEVEIFQQEGRENELIKRSEEYSDQYKEI